MSEDAELVAPPFVLELRPPPRRLGLGPLLLLIGVAVAAGAWLGAERLGPFLFSGSTTSAALGAVVGGALTAALTVMVWPRLRPPARLDPIALVGARLHLPRSVYAEGSDRLDVRDVLQLGVAPGAGGYLEVQTARRRYQLPLARLRQPERLAELDAAFRRALARLPGGPEHLHQLEEGHRLGQALHAVHPHATHALLALIVAVFTAQTVIGGLDADALDRARVSLRLGASAPVLNASEPWRLLTATFLHGGGTLRLSVIHVYMNGLALLALGGVLERLIGTVRFVSVFLWSALLGALLSSWASQASYAVGASGGIFGLLGALAALHVLARERLPARFRQSLRWWLFVVGLNVFLPVFVPIIDAWGHFGGFSAGLLLGAIFAMAPGFQLGGRPGWWARAGMGAAVGLYGFAALLAFTSALGPRPSHEANLERVLLGRPEAPLRQLAVVERIFASKGAERHLKQAADAWLGRAAMRSDADPALLLAHSERLEAQEALVGALSLRWRALQQRGSFAFAALVDGLARLPARPIALGSTPSSAVEIRRLLGDDRVDVLLEPPVARSAALFVLFIDERGLLQGVYEWPLAPADTPIAKVRARLSDEVRSSLEEGGRLEAALWASPPLSERPAFHEVSEAALADWRRLGPPRSPTPRMLRFER